MSEWRRGPVAAWSQVRALRGLFLATEVLMMSHKPFLKRFGLTMSEFDVIAALGNTQGLRMKEVARAMALSGSPSNATRVCASLEKRGLVQRRRADDNDREVIAELTAEGAALFDDAFPQVVEFTADLIDARLSIREQQQLRSLLDKFLDQ